MTREYSHQQTALFWTELFHSLSDPVALLQVNTLSSPTLLRSNGAFQQLFNLNKTNNLLDTTVVPADFILLLRELKPDSSPPLWCVLADDGTCRHFKLQSASNKTAADTFLLLMQDISEQENLIEVLKKQTDELQQRLTAIEQLKNRIREQSIRDPLTNLYNRRFLNEFMERELALARRNQKPLAVVMLDLDHFKQLNDQFGHQTGDMVIEMVAKHLLRQSRRTDVLFRYGGEEFLVILPNTNAIQAQHLAENWRVHVEQAQIFAKHQAINITLSAGISVYPEHGTTTFNLIQAADEALYQAKAAGRNQVVMS